MLSVGWVTLAVMPPVRVPRPLRSLGQSAPNLCLYEASVETCLAFGIVVFSAMHRLTGFEVSSTWLLLALTVANALRSGVSVAAKRFCAWLGMPLDQWRLVVAVPLLVPSYAILVGQVFAVVCLQRAAQQHSGRRSEPGAAEEMLSFYLAVTANMLSTAIWLVSMACIRIQTDEDREPPPKPQVTPFVVRDVDSECRGSACAICLEEFSSGCLAGRLLCNHVFHESCIRSWHDTRPFQACPMRCARADIKQESYPLERELATIDREMEAGIWIGPWIEAMAVSMT
jgi:hypothetical protein